MDSGRSGSGLLLGFPDLPENSQRSFCFFGHFRIILYFFMQQHICRFRLFLCLLVYLTESGECLFLLRKTAFCLFYRPFCIHIPLINSLDFVGGADRPDLIRGIPDFFFLCSALLQLPFCLLQFLKPSEQLQSCRTGISFFQIEAVRLPVFFSGSTAPFLQRTAKLLQNCQHFFQIHH